jgi:site-specific DNA recombinase
MIRVCLYARYSTDLQNDKSNEDQLRDLREFLTNVARVLGVDATHLNVVLAEKDAAKSGATIFQRAGLRRVRAAAASGAFDVLVTETPNRLARKVGESGLLYDELRYHRVRWFTITMGEMDPMKVGMMGAISQQNLEEGKHFTRRGLRGCIEDGRSAGGLSYGYRLDRTKKRISRRGQEEIVRGVLLKDSEQAGIVGRIFRLFVAGLSSKAIAKLLNAEGIRGPRGRVWRPSTIHGNQTTCTGILNNVLYIGQLRHGLREYRMNPETGLRGKAIMNPPTALKVKDVPHLRIIDDELWQAVKLRQAATKRAQRAGLDRARRPKFLFSKLTKCGVCGGGFTTESRADLRCHNYVAAGESICTNRRVIKRTEVERRVLVALQERFLTPERLEEFTRVYVAETNRLRAEHPGETGCCPTRP